MKFFLIAFINACLVSSLNAQIKIEADSLSKHVYTLADDSYEGRSIGAKGGAKAAYYIANQFKILGINPLLDSYFHHFVYVNGAVASEGKNVVAIIEGSHAQLKHEYIVVGAHYDHIGYYFNKPSKEKIIYNGADDNASGVATLIELGRKIVNSKDQFERSIVLVAFDGEESGLNGSKWMIRDSLLKPSQIKLMLSIDMVGMLSANNGIELLGIGTLKDGEILARQLASKNQLPIKKTSNILQTRTDTKPFGDIGIPATHITTGTVSPYHKPEDDANLLDYEGMAQITEFIYNFTIKVASNDSIKLVSTLTNKKGEVRNPKFIPGIRLNVGPSWHNYTNEFYNGKDAFALQTGLYAHIKLSHRVDLQPELLYETMASKNTNGKFRTHAITTPLNILFSFAGNHDYDIWSYFVLGGYYTFNLEGKEGSKNIDYNNFYEQNEYGANLGFVLNISKVQIGITRKIGLSNLYRQSSGTKLHNNAIFGTIGLQF